VAVHHSNARRWLADQISNQKSLKRATIISIVGALVCAAAVWESARIGIARSQAMNALSTNGIAAAERSVQLAPRDAEVHAARGVVLQRTENYPEACRELERATELRPRDYFLWMLLGVTRDLNDDQPGGLAALRESVRLAPFYAKPRWLLGNLLLRMGQVEEAFQQMRFAEERDATLLPNVIDLAWGTSGNDPAKTVALVQPQTDGAHMALAIFLASHKEGAVAMDQFRNAKSTTATASQQLTQRLIELRFFGEAYEVWTKARCPSCKPASFVNGSFEEDIELNPQGFGWQIPGNMNGVTLSVDTSEHENGAKSLRIDFHGNTDTQSKLVSQLVVVEPGRRYRVSLRAMTKSFVSAARPVVSLVDASDEKLTVLGESLITADAVGWRPYVITFAAGPNTRALRLIVSLENCPEISCGAFGTLWLDSIRLEQSAGER
jgi:hypothetical protein